jgi:lipoprotein LprG
MIRWLVVPLLLVAATACTGNKDQGNAVPQTPDAAQLLQKSAAAMRQVETVRFDLKVDGRIQGIAISAAQGQLTRAGNVKGTATITATGQPTEAEFVIIGDTMYLKGPTGGFQKLPTSLAASVYDPTKILDPNQGLGALVAGATQPSVQGRETVDGVDTYHLKVTFARNNLGVLLPGVGSSADLPGDLWIAATEPNLPIKAKVDVPAPSAAPGGTVTITLSEFDKPVTIAPPS